MEIDSVIKLTFCDPYGEFFVVQIITIVFFLCKNIIFQEILYLLSLSLSYNLFNDFNWNNFSGMWCGHFKQLRKQSEEKKAIFSRFLFKWYLWKKTRLEFIHRIWIYFSFFVIIWYSKNFFFRRPKTRLGKFQIKKRQIIDLILLWLLGRKL